MNDLTPAERARCIRAAEAARARGHEHDGDPWNPEREDLLDDDAYAEWVDRNG